MTTIPISIKHGVTTYHMHLDNQADLPKAEQFNLIATHIHIPSDRLKLIYKGKRYTKDNWQDLTLTSNMNFLSIGEQNEDETNVDTKDVECIMLQLKVDRNAAMTRAEIREGAALFEQAFTIHRQIPEFDIQSTAHEQLHERIRNVKQPLILVGNVDDQPAGYLMGYERNGSFYIWLAGVLPAYRRHGVLSQLMTRAEQWARSAHYTSLTIKTRNCFKSMLLFLVSQDFKIIDVDKRESPDSHRLLLEKTLSAS